MMMRYVTHVILAVLLFFTSKIEAQVLSFDHGKVEFYTSSIMSDIGAISEEVQVRLDVPSGEVEIKIAIESFEFEYEMMQEHVADEYLESNLFPEAIFKGKIVQDISNILEETEIDVSGDLTIHGVKRETKFKASISKKEGYTLVKCKFLVIFEHFNVEEPAILSKSVAKDVEVKSVLYLN